MQVRFATIVVASCLWGAGSALAQSVCGSLPYTMSNGTTADASQVNANYSHLLGCFSSPAFSGDVRFNGHVTFGASVLASRVMNVSSSGITTGASQGGIEVNFVPTSASTANTVGFLTSLSSATASYTVTDMMSFLAQDVTQGSGSTISNQYGVVVADQTKGTNNYGLKLGVSSGTTKWNLYADGTAKNHIKGELLLNTTTAGGGFSGLGGTEALTSYHPQISALFLSDNGATNETVLIGNSATSGNNSFVTFYTEAFASPSLRGLISYDRANGMTLYSGTSDYRSKDLFGLFNDMGKIIDAIPVYLGQMKGSSLRRPMVVAHEVQAVAPWAVTGEKDAVDKEGKPVMQQLSQGALVELLLAEIQDLRRRLTRVEGWTQK